MASPADPNRATNDLLRRVPPHSVEAEQAVLGGIFIRNSVFHTLVDTLSSDDFYLPAHQTLYTCFLELYRKNAPIDLVSVKSVRSEEHTSELQSRYKIAYAVFCWKKTW